jgi:hypothetical protein
VTRIELLRLGEVLAGAERAIARPGQDDGVDPVVSVQPFQRPAERGAHRQVPGVQLLGAVQGDGADAVVDIDQDALGHSDPSPG